MTGDHGPSDTQQNRSLYQNRSFCCNFEDTLQYQLPPILIVVFVLGLVFNGIALCTFCYHVKNWTSSTIYLFNLAVADFLLLFCLPFRTHYYMKGKKWIFGDALCRVVLFMLATSRAGSIFFLTLVALDRYFRVVYPHHRMNAMSVKGAICIACVIWAGTMTLTFVIFMNGQSDVRHVNYCESFTVCPVPQLVYHDLLFILEFFLPLGVILYCSSRIVWRLKQRKLDRHSKIRRAVHCIILVAIIFCVCFLPSVSTRIEVLRLLTSPQGKDCVTYRTVDRTFYITITFTYMNSMCNPLVYYFSSPSFKVFFLKIMRCSNLSESESEMDQTNDAPTTVHNSSQLPDHVN